MEPKSMDKRLEKGEETYKRILSAAIDLIAESGISGISAAKLSNLTQISKSTIFHHFRTTKEIPEEVLKLIFSKLLITIEENEEDLFVFLKNLGTYFIETLDQEVKIYKTFFSFYHESIFHSEYQRYMRDFLIKSRERLENKIKKLSPKLTDQDIQAFAILIISSLDGIGLHLLIGGEREQYVAAWEFQVKLFSNMVTC